MGPLRDGERHLEDCAELLEDITERVYEAPRRP
jgi:hypothetical protein